MFSNVKALILSGKSPLTGLNKYLQRYCQWWRSSLLRHLLQELHQGACLLGNFLTVTLRGVEGMWGCAWRMQEAWEASLYFSLQPILPVRLCHCEASPHQVTTSTGWHCFLCTHPLRTGPTRMATIETGETDRSEILRRQAVLHYLSSRCKKTNVT